MDVMILDYQAADVLVRRRKPSFLLSCAIHLHFYPRLLGWVGSVPQVEEERGDYVSRSVASTTVYLAKALDRRV